MKENIEFLFRKINTVCNKDYLLTYINAGLLFEGLLDIKPNDFSVPDIDGIEIKVSNKKSNYPISLFSCTFDGKDFFESKHFLDRFGAKDKILPSQKVMYMDVNANAFCFWGRYLKMKLHLDYKKEKLYILVSHANGKIIEKRSYWDFNTLYCALERKIKFLCLVDYISYYRNGKKYCKFSNPTLLEYRGFSYFLKLLEKGDIFVNINCGVYRSGKNVGKSCIHGFTFKIKKTALLELFNIKKNST